MFETFLQVDPTALLQTIVAGIGAAISLNLLAAAYRRKTSAPEPISEQLASTLSALENNSKQATALLAQLQAEISKRPKKSRLI